MNYIILSTKQFIFICLKQNKIPNYVDLLHHLSFKYKIETYASVEKFQHRKFEKYWSHWENFLSFNNCMTKLYRGGISIHFNLQTQVHFDWFLNECINGNGMERE